MTRRVRFEVRVLGVAVADTFHFEEAVAEVPKPGELAGPMRSMTAWRRVVAVGRMGEMSVVTLEPIDCSQLERDRDAEEAALREAGWRQ
jgi:hypothetical protein